MSSIKKINFTFSLLTTAILLTACNNDNNADSNSEVCLEQGEYACKTGETEPLYTLQWALKYTDNYFSEYSDVTGYGGGYDLNIEPVHQRGIKGQGVNVLVMDSGVDLEHEDLKENADYSISWNFTTNTNDPNPVLTHEKEAHGTLVAGMIAASQNGKGTMGIAPKAKIGGSSLVADQSEDDDFDDSVESRESKLFNNDLIAIKKVDVINASYGGDFEAQPYVDEQQRIKSIRQLKHQRAGKGIAFVKSLGNEFQTEYLDENISTNCGSLEGYYDCINPTNDIISLEPHVINITALNAKGVSSSYSSIGSLAWVTGIGGEYGEAGHYGTYGPVIYSTDIRGCDEGYSNRKDFGISKFLRDESALRKGVLDNPNCDYAYMNGTSSAAPTITGVIALMLSANPDLTWRDIRDILRASARQIDLNYHKKIDRDLLVAQGSAAVPYNSLLDLKNNKMIDQVGYPSLIKEGANKTPVELGWQKNAAGNYYSNWYGFGLPDAAKAVDLALIYKRNPYLSKSAVQHIPSFTKISNLKGFEYQKISLIGEYQGTEEIVDQIQVRLNANNLCLGSLGIAVESPSGTKSLLKMPADHFYNFRRPEILELLDVNFDDSEIENYALGSYAFYGENAKGTWKVYALASNPILDPKKWHGVDKTCEQAPVDGKYSANAKLQVEARVVAQ